MKLGNYSLLVNLPVSRWAEYEELILANSYDVELYVTADEMDNLSVVEIKHIGDVISQQGLKICLHAPFMDLSPGSVDDRIREVTVDRFIEALVIAEILGAGTTVFHHGYDKRKHEDVQELWFAQCLKTWTVVVNEARKRGVVVAVENVFDESPEMLKKLFCALDSCYCGWCLDVGHLNLFSTVTMDTWLKEIGDNLVEVHLHDNWGIRDDHLAIGDGSVDFGPVKTFLASCKRPINLILEIRSEQAARKSIERVTAWLTQE